ncbi:MAG TPA: hypothetical protein VH817_07675, partial [Thermoleophilaceae bacterium]
MVAGAARVRVRGLIEIATLADGQQRAEDVGARLVDFLAKAQKSLEIALYDVRLPDGIGEHVSGALRGAAERGVKVR